MALKFIIFIGVIKLSYQMCNLGNGQFVRQPLDKNSCPRAMVLSVSGLTNWPLPSYTYDNYILSFPSDIVDYHPEKKICRGRQNKDRQCFQGITILTMSSHEECNTYSIVQNVPFLIQNHLALIPYTCHVSWLCDVKNCHTANWPIRLLVINISYNDHWWGFSTRNAHMVHIVN